MVKETKYTPSEIRKALKDLMLNGYHHIKAINNEIHVLNVKDPNEASDEVKQKLQTLTLTLTLVNDLLHPCHKIAKQLMNKSEHGIVDYAMKAQRIAFESKLVEECFCWSCTEDKNVK